MGSTQRMAPPAPAPHVLDRPRLAPHLAQLSSRRLTTFVAGAGFGKTTLLAGWAAERNCAWYTVAAADRDPLALAAGIVGALRLRVPDLPRELADTLAGMRGTGELGSFVPILAVALHERLRSDLVLVLDDVHLIGDGPAALLLAELCHAAPELLHLVLAGRGEPSFAMERVHRLLLTAEDLRFDPAEAAALLTAVAGTSADEYGARACSLTGGWPVAVRLVAEALAEIPPGERAGALSGWAVAGGVGDLLDDLLTREVMPRASAPVLALMRVAAALDAFDAGLLTDLGVPDAAEALAEARGRGVLVSATPGDPDRYTLTAVARRHVVRRLSLADAEVTRIRRVAAARHAARDEPVEAARYLVRLGDGPGLAALLARHGRDLLASGHVGLVVASAGAADRSAVIDLLEGEAHQIRGDWDRAVECLSRLVPDGGPVPVAVAWRLGLIHHLRGELSLALDLYRRGLADPDGGELREQALCAAWGSGAAWMYGEVEECRILAGLAATLAERSGDHTAAAAAYTARAMLAALDGDRRMNDLHYLRALEHAQLAGDVLHLIRIRSNRGSRFLEEGQYADACAELDTAVRLAELADYPTLRTFALANRAEARRRLGRLDEAERDLRTALAEQERLGSRLASYPLVGLGDVHLDQGNAVAARSCFERAAALAEAGGDLQSLVPALAGLALAVGPYDMAGAARIAQRAVDVGPALGRTRALLAVAHIAAARLDGGRALVAASAAAEAARERRDRAALAEALEVKASLAADRAVRQAGLAEAETLWADLGCPLGLWRTRVALAEFADRFSASETLAAAAAQARRIGARGLATRAAAALAALAETPPAALTIRTLGGFQVARHGSVIPYGEWRRRKARDLLEILVASRGRPDAPDALAAVLWPDESAGSAVGHLSVTLAELRAILDPVSEFPIDHYVADRGGAVWLRTDHADVDVEAFLAGATEVLARWAEPAATAAVGATELSDVEARYTGDFCAEDLTVARLAVLREEARTAYVSVVRALAESYALGGDHEATAQCLLRLLAQDPFDEPAHLALVRALDRAGEHAEARRMYRAYTVRMAELSTEPAAYPS